MDQLDRPNPKGDDLRRVVQEEVKQFNTGVATTNKEFKIQCMTCTLTGFDCLMSLSLLFKLSGAIYPQ